MPTRPLNGRIVLRRSFARFPFWYAPAAAILFGTTLLMPGDTFALSTSFNVMRRLGELAFGPGNAENGWGATILAIGAGQLFAVLFVRSQRVALIMLWLLSILFALMAASFFSTNGINSTGTGTYTLTALMAVWAFIKWEA